MKKIICYNCGDELDSAALIPLVDSNNNSILLLACPTCGVESIVTINKSGLGTETTEEELKSVEAKWPRPAREVTVDDVLEVHLLFKRGSLWKYLKPEKEKFLGKKSKDLEEKVSFRQ